MLKLQNNFLKWLEFWNSISSLLLFVWYAAIFLENWNDIAQKSGNRCRQPWQLTRSVKNVFHFIYVMINVFLLFFLQVVVSLRSLLADSLYLCIFLFYMFHVWGVSVSCSLPVLLVYAFFENVCVSIYFPGTSDLGWDPRFWRTGDFARVFWGGTSSRCKKPLVWKSFCLLRRSNLLKAFLHWFGDWKKEFIFITLFVDFQN